WSWARRCWFPTCTTCRCGRRCVPRELPRRNLSMQCPV
ncbi:MAG: hypothetical protein AVDCRST_MAG10-3267, partial [uncultured Acidimicrobiales bacterium]